MDKVILAKGVELEGGLGLDRPNDNQIVFGSTGSGKSVSVLLATLCHIIKSSFIATFAKGGVVKKAVRFFKRRRYKCVVWNLANPGKTDNLPDPLDYVSSDDDITDLAHQIAYSNPDYQRATKFDPYWLDAAIGLMIALIYFVLHTIDCATMRDVIDLFYSLRIEESGKGITTSLDNRFAWLRDKVPDSIAVRKFQAFQQLPYGTAGCVLDSLDKAIQTMFPTTVLDAMSEKAYVDFEELATVKTALFIITSPVRTSTYAFANMMFGIAIRQLTEFAEKREDNHLPKDVKLFFDDFSCGFPIIGYEKAISTFRSAGVSAMMLCQSLSQLDATYGEHNSTVILDNCAAMVYLPGGMNKKTCSYVSEMLDSPLESVMFMKLGNAIVFQSVKITDPSSIVQDRHCGFLFETLSANTLSTDPPSPVCPFSPVITSAKSTIFNYILFKIRI